MLSLLLIMLNTLTTWPAPAGEAPSPHYTLTAADQPVFVYHAPVRAEIWQHPGLWSHQPGCATQAAAFAIFDIAAPVPVVVRPARPFRTAEVLPERAGIVPTVVDGALTFTVREPRHLTLVLDGDDTTPLHLFIGAPEQDVPRADDPNVLYFGPGVHEVEAIRPASGQTVYLAGGAVVKARLAPGEQGKYSERFKVTTYGGIVIHLKEVERVTVRGRGILDASLVPHPGRNMIGLDQARHCRLSGITLRDAANWNVRVGNSSDIVVEDLRIVSARLNSDGINSVNSQRVQVRGCFARTCDDSIVVKTTQPAPAAEDIVVEDCQVWNDWGYALGVTYETRAPIQRVTFRRCDLLRARNWCLGLHLSDGATVSGITFRDIAVSRLACTVANPADTRPNMTPLPLLLRGAIVQDMWGHDAERGRIRDLVLEQIVLHGDRMLRSELKGADAEHDIQGVTLKGIRLAGQPPAADAAALQLSTNAHASGITIAP
jgi:hypothetical protein